MNTSNQKACSAARVSEKPFFPTKTLLYVLVHIDHLPQHLKLVGKIARLLESSILVVYFSDKNEVDQEAFQAIQQEIKSMSNYSKIKFSFFENTAHPCTEIQKIKEEKDICALAFPSEKEFLTSSIFSNPKLHTSIPVFAL
ncbi:hypothetical protein [Aureispira sp. CCB-E]|uniref:hypothetical protein n=1 Tax=Aureispira sp. CCB-E TaxID=3051121 RepID=UPI002868A11C|nr:hypothetical protein [Aureispira sp. CCB-E]WMX12319.1 hypothetical protein QP953_15935 [Aureispira sp. CCB-E]